MADEGKPGSPNVDIIVNGTEISDGDIRSWQVIRDMGQADWAQVKISNQSDAYGTKFKSGDKLEIKVGKDKKTVFIGKLTESKNEQKGSDPKSIVISAINGMAPLIRKRESKTFQDKNDKQIIQEIVTKAGLTLDYKGPQITYKHVYRHNQTGLEFIRARAARLGCHVWCWDSKLFVKEPDFSKTAGTKLSADKAGILRSFVPRRNDQAATKKVTVKCWDCEKKELIVGTATASSSPLGPKHASAAASDADPEHTIVDQPVGSKQEADAVAKGELMERNLGFMTGTAVVAGGAHFDLAEVVEIEHNAMGQDEANGKYYIVGISHQHTLDKNAADGYVTTLRLKRDAAGM